MAVTDDDALGGKKRTHEEDYFRKQDQALIERMRKAAAAQAAERALEAKTGLHDPDVLRAIQELGFTAETVSLIPLVPILQVAWAEGGVSDAERRLLLEIARTRGIEPGSLADQQLADWMHHRPSGEVFARAGRLITAMLAVGSEETRDLTVQDLVKYCEAIAAASGGIFGVGKVSAEERALLTQIQKGLRQQS
jgi:tellurite resistance protein